MWVTEHPNTLLRDIYFCEHSRGEVHHYADGSVSPCIISAIREVCFGTFLRSPVKNNPRVSFLQREVFIPGAGLGLNFVSAELGECQNIFAV